MLALMLCLVTKECVKEKTIPDILNIKDKACTPEDWNERFS
jgi:hypothetical protein